MLTRHAVLVLAFWGKIKKIRKYFDSSINDSTLKANENHGILVSVKVCVDYPFEFHL